jgi:hypothetical protein
MARDDSIVGAYTQKFEGLVRSVRYDFDTEEYIVVFQTGQSERRLILEVPDYEARGRLAVLTRERVSALLDELGGED